MEIKEGQILHPLKVPDALAKCSGPIEAETYDKETGKFIPLTSYFLTREFPKPHFFVISELLDNYLYPEHPFCLAHIITHTDGFDNVAITADQYNPVTTTTNLANKKAKSYITRDKFLIRRADVKLDKSYGDFYLDKLKDAIEY